VKGFLRYVLGRLFNVKLLGWETLRFDGPAIILPNHQSFWDAVFLYAFLPRSACFVINTAMAARISFFLRWINHITVDPFNPYSLKKIVAAVKAGHPVVLFPEGRITTTGNLMKIYSGIGFVALKTGAVLHPVIFSGLQYSKLSRITDKVRSAWFPQVTVYAAAPLWIIEADTKNFKQQKRAISDKILAVLQEALFQTKQHLTAGNNLFDRLLAAGRFFGMGRIMAEDLSGTITYRRAIRSSYVLAGKLRSALAGENRTGVFLPNSIGHVIALFALLYADITPAIFNLSAGVQNNLDCGHTAGLKTILTSRTFVEKAGLKDYITQLAAEFRIVYLEDLRAQMGLTTKMSGLINYFLRKRAAGKAKIILFTSGSESKPKGVVLRQENILANINQAGSIIDYTQRDKMFNALPMFHSFGLTAGTLLPVFEGIEVFLYPSPLHFKVIPELAYDRRVTLVLGTPTFLMAYAKHAHPYDFFSLRYCLAGGEKLKEEVRTIWHEKFGIRILEGYGTTETAPVLCLNTPLFHRTGTVGRFLPGIEWRLEEVAGIATGGNLLVKGPNVMEGYLLHGQGLIPADEWYNCGDVVTVDDDGFVTIKSRLKRFAKVSGEMVSLDAVERAAEKAFGSDKNAAISLADGRKGEKIILYTLDKSASLQVLRTYFNKTRQSMLALPAALVLVDRLPLLGSGKVDYVRLRAQAGGEEDTHAP
jgi:acyl-[acyl-carrier-protein]-phospholipid O-acyltransferase / long-chain-fatty-acid--[acyl-carrier-protein] ligase